MVIATKGETRACGRMDCLLSEIFLLVGRSGRGDSKVGGHRSDIVSPENLSSSRGDLMTAEDSIDEGEVAGVRCDP